MKDELLRLAAICEQADGSDRELDTLIHFATTAKWIGRIPTWPPTKISRPAMETGLAMHIEGDGYFYGDDVPMLTASLDAALTLVLEGLVWSVDGPDSSKARVTKLLDGHTFTVLAATPALAICATALKARASMENPQ